jgi:hypothetical protein
MDRDWIREGLRSEAARADERRLARERRLQQKRVIEEKGPDLTRQLVAEVSAAVEQFTAEGGQANATLVFEPLPHEGFCLERTVQPRVTLECRPSYDAACIYCNITRDDDVEPEVLATAFLLRFIVTDSNRVELRHENRTFETVGELVEFLLAPVFFPPVEPTL